MASKTPGGVQTKEGGKDKRGLVSRLIGDDREGVYALAAVLAAILFIALRAWLMGCTCDEVPDLLGRVAIITGGSDGIGTETARRLHALGAHVVLPVRNLTKGNLAVEAWKGDGARVTVKHMDLNQLSSVRKFVGEFQRMGLPLDILINNAGVWPAVHGMTPDGFQEAFQVNHLSHFLLTNLLLGDLKKTAEKRKRPSRVVSLSSIRQYFGKLDRMDLIAKGLVMNPANYTGMGGYDVAKLLTVVFAKELQRRVDESPAYKGKVTSTSVHPGIIHTALHRGDKEHFPGYYRLYSVVVGLLGKTVEGGAQTSVYAAISSKLEGKGGVFLSDCAIASHNKEADDLNKAKEVWKISQKLSKVGSAGL